MIGVHEDEKGTTYLRAVSRRGDIVNLRDTWGVVTSHERWRRYHPSPLIMWLVDGEWQKPERYSGENLSAPYSHTYEAIPDEVIAKATELKLLDGAE